MFLVAINVGILLALLTQKKSKKAPLQVGLLFGAIKTALYVAFGSVAATSLGAPEAIVDVVILGALRGGIGFLSAWGLLTLLKRIDDIELAARLAPPGVIVKQKAVVLEWFGVLLTGLICALS